MDSETSLSFTRKIRLENPTKWDFKSMVDVLRASLVRFMLVLFTGVTVWRVREATDNIAYWLLLALILPMLLEWFLVLILSKGQENKWFCFCFLVFLLAMIPNIWILQLTYSSTVSSNATSTSNHGHADEIVIQIAGFKMEIALDQKTWLTGIQQFTVLSMIIGRMVLPNSQLTHGMLSNLLVVFVGIGADIVEFYEPLEDSNVIYDTTLTHILLAVWSASLFQYTVVLTGTLTRKVRPGPNPSVEKSNTIKNSLVTIFTDERWSIILTAVLMDLPYFVIRMYLIIQYKIINYSILYFAVKNAMLLVFQLYRFVTICMSDGDGSEEEREGHLDGVIVASQTAITLASDDEDDIDNASVKIPMTVTSSDDIDNASVKIPMNVDANDGIDNASVKIPMNVDASDGIGDATAVEIPVSLSSSGDVDVDIPETKSDNENDEILVAERP